MERLRPASAARPGGGVHNSLHQKNPLLNVAHRHWEVLL